MIDGSQFCYNFYQLKELDSTKGGQYPEFYQMCTEFFENLLRSEITPHVVFEGINKNEKLTDDYRKEKVKRVPNLPQLAFTTLCNVLTHMKIRTYVADGEGDVACAKIAKHFECPVLSNDSDFYLFDICCYIQLNDLKFQPGDESHNTCVAEAEVYRKEVFTRDILHLLESDLLYLIPSIIGNDSVEYILRGKIYSRIKRVAGEKDKGKQNLIKWIVTYLTKRDSLKSCLEDIDSKDLKEQVEIVSAYYTPSPQAPVDIVDKSSFQGLQTPEWFNEEYKKHAIPYMLVDALINKKQHHSNLPVSLRIRKGCYRILGVETVDEYPIRDGNAVLDPVQWWCESELPSLVQIPKMPRDKRESCLFSILLLRPDQLKDVQKTEKFFMSTIVFWNETDQKPPCLIKALLACYVLCSSNSETLEAAKSRICTEECEGTVSQHFLDWQSVYRDAVALSTLLQCSDLCTCPSKIYDGKIATSLASRSDGIDGVVESLENFDSDKYRALCRVCRLIP